MSKITCQLNSGCHNLSAHKRHIRPPGSSGWMTSRCTPATPLHMVLHPASSTTLRNRHYLYSRVAPVVLLSRDGLLQPGHTHPSQAHTLTPSHPSHATHTSSHTHTSLASATWSERGSTPLTSTCGCYVCRGWGQGEQRYRV